MIDLLDNDEGKKDILLLLIEDDGDVGDDAGSNGEESIYTC